MIVLFTDFGIGSPYIGQMQNVLYQHAPEQQLITLFSDAPSYNPRASAYLLPAYVGEFPEGTIFLCVVDPGVGSDTRKPVILNIDDRWYVGPDNGLFNVVGLRANNKQKTRWWDITWQPDKLSSSFHGRDMFAPVAAMLANGKMPEVQTQNAETRIDPNWPTELEEIVYIDHFGNAISGIRAEAISKQSHVVVQQYDFTYARTFSDVSQGQSFWYINANGLVELAVNQGNACETYNVNLGDRIQIQR